MLRLTKIGKITPKNSNEIKNSRLGLGFEKLDRDVFDPEKAYDKVAELGVKWIRIQSGWARTEKQKGVYDFAWLDNVVDNLCKRGLKPWICLCYGNGLYDENAAKYFGAVGVPPIFNVEQKTAWKNYVTALVNRYKDRVTHYEVWNEPDGIWCWKHGVNAAELGLFTAETGKIVHDAFPEAEVIGLVQCHVELKYVIDAFTDTGMADNIDAISFHEYTHDESNVPRRVASLHAIADMFKPGIKVIQGESGSQSRTGGNGALRLMFWTEKAQTKQLARHTMINLSTDVEFTSYFSCMDMIEALNGTADDKASYQDYGYFGVLGADFDENGFSIGTYTPKPSYYALQTISSVFSEDYDIVKNYPMLFKAPDESIWEINCTKYAEPDCNGAEITKAFYRRDNGSECFVYWKPTNILTTDYNGSVSFEMVTRNKVFKLVDMCTGDVYSLPDGMIEDTGNGSYMVKHLPVKDTPLALIMGDFCDFSKE